MDAVLDRRTVLMRAGALRHRMQLQAPTHTRDSHGQKVITWPVGSTYATVWAAITDLSGRELEHAQQIHATATVLARIRYRSDVTAEHRGVVGSRTLEFVAPPQDREGRKRELHIVCREVK